MTPRCVFVSWEDQQIGHGDPPVSIDLGRVAPAQTRRP